MAIRQIRVLGDDVLRKKCKEVKEMNTKNAYISRRYV